MHNIYILKWLYVNSSGKKKVREAYMLVAVVRDSQISITTALPVQQRWQYQLLF